MTYFPFALSELFVSIVRLLICIQTNLMVSIELLIIVLNDDTNKITKIVPITHNFLVFCIPFIPPAASFTSFRSRITAKEVVE